MAAARHLLCRKRALSVLCLDLLHEEEEKRPPKKKRKVYMRDWISRREERGISHQLVKKLEAGDAVAYKDFFRMSREQFSILLEKVSPLIRKKISTPTNQCCQSDNSAGWTPSCDATVFSNWRNISFPRVLFQNIAADNFINRVWDKPCPIQGKKTETRSLD